MELTFYEVIKIKRVVDEKRTVADKPDPVQIKGFEKRYDKVIENGLAENPLPVSQGQPRRSSKKKQNKAKNLLDEFEYPPPEGVGLYVLF